MRQWFVSPRDTITELNIGQHFDAAKGTVIAARLCGNAKWLPVIGAAEDFYSHVHGWGFSSVFHRHYGRRVRVCSDAAKTYPWAVINLHFIKLPLHDTGLNPDRFIRAIQGSPLRNADYSGCRCSEEDSECRESGQTFRFNEQRYIFPAHLVERAGHTQA